LFGRGINQVPHDLEDRKLITLSRGGLTILELEGLETEFRTQRSD
jgi:hypothetical protein